MERLFNVNLKKEMSMVMTITILVFSSVLNAQITWTKHLIENHSQGGTYTSAGDIDGNGDIDIIQEYMPTYELSWFENDGEENFTKHIIDNSYFLGGRKPFPIDFDGDGDMDIIRQAYWDVGAEFYETAWYENDGNQNFIKHTITKDTMAMCFYPVDLDNDGDMDIILPFYYQVFNNKLWISKFTWYENDGNMNFTQHIIENYLTNGCMSSVYPIDLDNDGDIDILCTYLALDCIAWFENNGHQIFTKHVIDSFESYPKGIYSIDMDRDGDLDVFANWDGQAGNPHLVWHENDGTQNFIRHPISPDKYADDFELSDPDNDGDIDILYVQGNGANRIAWYENDGNQNFSHHPIDSIFVPLSIKAEDIDGDGDVDFTSGGYYETVWYENSTVNIKEFHSLDVKDSGAFYIPRGNIFSNFVTVPGHEDGKFILYGITGSQRGTFRGSQIGLGLKSGIYFLVPANKISKPVKILKIH